MDFLFSNKHVGAKASPRVRQCLCHDFLTAVLSTLHWSGEDAVCRMGKVKLTLGQVDRAAECGESLYCPAASVSRLALIRSRCRTVRVYLEVVS